MTVTVPAPVPPCPSWCARPAGHGLPLRAGGVTRLHLGAPHEVSGDALEVEQHEVVTAAGVSWPGPLRMVGRAGPVAPTAPLAGVAG